MSNNLADVWVEVEALLNQNISIIPVRDKDTIYHDKLYKAKTPYSTWTKYQNEIIDRSLLWQEMSEKNTTAIAMVCGAISGNLEVIDFDVKYLPGIDAIVINAIHEFYPDILAKIRVHRTRSGGAHLIYRIENHEVPPSTHLAERLATPEEMELNPKGGKTRCFIETRGTGGLATAPPSLGYSVRKNTPIQNITWEERCSIIELCKVYNQYIQELKPYKPPISEVNYYDENPFEHYNRTVDPVELFSEYGWTFVKKFGDYVWFTRPGGRRNEVHAGFNFNTHTYRIWGTKSDFDSEKSYTPSTVLAHYLFNGDKSATYHHLVQKGYGRIKPFIETKMARTKAMQGRAMPVNASPAAIEKYNQHVEQLHTAHPQGIFWEPDDDDPNIMHISRLGFKEVALKLGFRLHQGEPVQIIDQFIYRRDERFFFDSMRDYIKEEDQDIYESIYNATQAFLQKNGRFELSQIDILDLSIIVHDTRTCCYKFYTNGYVLITPDSYELHEYESLNDKFIWHEKVQQREFVCNTGHNEGNISSCSPTDYNDDRGHGLYTDFLRLACDLDNNRDHIMKCIGYLTHDYKDEALGYIIVLTEKCENPEDGGGTGKNLFGSLLGLTTSYTSVPGSQIQLNEKFLQSWNGERVFCVSDAEQDFEFRFLKDMSTGKVIIKKLFKDEKTFDPAMLPKFIVNTNYSYDIKDGGLKRRIIHIEFTDFFTINGGVKNHFGKMFPHDWDENDYSNFDHFVCQSIKLWLQDLILKRISLSATGWEKQFLLNYNNTIVSFIKNNWDEWKQKEFVSNTDFNKQLDEHLIEQNIPLNSRYRPSSIKVNKALTEWCKKHDYDFHKEVVMRDGPFGLIKGRKFLPGEPPF